MVAGLAILWMIWKGHENFKALMEGAGYVGKEGLERLVEDLKGLLAKPPTAGSIRTSCLFPSGRGIKRPETIAALCLVLRCREEALYEQPQKAQAAVSRHVSTWDWIRAGVDVADRESWPI